MDLTGQKFNNLTVIKLKKKRKNKRKIYKCNCDCGNTTEASGSDLISNRVKSCGCIKKRPKIVAVSEFKKYIQAGLLNNVRKKRRLSQLAREYNINKSTLWYRIYRSGYDVNTALGRPQPSLTEEDFKNMPDEDEELVDNSEEN